MVDTCDLFGSDSRVPRTWEEGGKDVQLLRGMEESLGERDRFVLIFLLAAD
jgi:hypothetical protein